MANPKRSGGTAGGRDESGIGTLIIRATQAGQGHPKAREGLNTLGFPIPYLPSASADGILIPVAFQRMAQYTRKQICNGYEPAGETIHGMVEGGNWKVTEKASSHSPEWTLWTPRWRRGKE